MPQIMYYQLGWDYNHSLVQQHIMTNLFGRLQLCSADLLQYESTVWSFQTHTHTHTLEQLSVDVLTPGRPES